MSDFGIAETRPFCCWGRSKLDEIAFLGSTRNRQRMLEVESSWSELLGSHWKHHPMLHKSYAHDSRPDIIFVLEIDVGHSCSSGFRLSQPKSTTVAPYGLPSRNLRLWQSTFFIGKSCITYIYIEIPRFFSCPTAFYNYQSTQTYILLSIYLSIDLSIYLTI